MTNNLLQLSFTGELQESETRLEPAERGLKEVWYTIALWL